MGLVAIAEAPFPDSLSRRQFLGVDHILERRNRSRGSQPPRRPRMDSPLAQPEPPERGGIRITRRQALILAGSIAAGSAISALLKPWNWLREPPQSEPETLESIVAQAKKIEAEFSGNDLSDKLIRNNFTNILADIYSKDAPSDWTQERIRESVIWAKNLDEFTQLVMNNSQRQRGVKNRDYFTTIAALTTDNKKIIVNVANPAFNTILLRNAGFPHDWNALKLLRRTLLHEFVHLTTTPKKDEEFLKLTDLPQNIEDPIMDGFVLDYSEQRQPRELFHVINELVVETITSERSNRLFGLTPPIPFIEQDVDLSTAQTRFKPVLDAAGIKITDLERFSRSSDFYGFLVNLSTSIDFDPSISLGARLNYVLNILDAVLYNNQPEIQGYINRAKAKHR